MEDESEATQISSDDPQNSENSPIEGNFIFFTFCTFKRSLDCFWFNVVVAYFSKFDSKNYEEVQ